MKIFYLFFLITLVIFSCKKDANQKNQSNNSTTKTDTITNLKPSTPSSGTLIGWNEVDSSSLTTFNTSLTYEYDSNGKLIIVNGTGGFNDNYTGNIGFTYSSNTLTINSQLGPVIGYFIKNGNIDANGRLIKLSDSANTYETYQYSSDGYLIESQIYEGGVLTWTYTYNFQDGNLISINFYDNINNKNTGAANFTYYTDKAAMNKIDFALCSELPKGQAAGGGFSPIIYNSDILGKQSANLLKSYVGYYTLTYIFSSNQVVQINTDANQKINLTYQK